MWFGDTAATSPRPSVHLVQLLDGERTVPSGEPPSEQNWTPIGPAGSHGKHRSSRTPHSLRYRHVPAITPLLQINLTQHRFQRF